jgi:hypothetical protein
MLLVGWSFVGEAVFLQKLKTRGLLPQHPWVLKNIQKMPERSKYI